MAKHKLGGVGNIDLGHRERNPRRSVVGAPDTAETRPTLMGLETWLSAVLRATLPVGKACSESPSCLISSDL